MGRPRISLSKTDSNSKYCKRYREKNKQILKKKGRGKEKEAKEHQKYVWPEKCQNNNV